MTFENCVNDLVILLTEDCFKQAVYGIMCPPHTKQPSFESVLFSVQCYMEELFQVIKIYIYS
jgi:hypothetical protein